MYLTRLCPKVSYFGIEADFKPSNLTYFFLSNRVANFVNPLQKVIRVPSGVFRSKPALPKISR